MKKLCFCLFIYLSSIASISTAENLEIKQVQKYLTSLGYNAGEADGIMGPKTRKAIDIFYAEKLNSGASNNIQEILIDIENHIIPKRKNITKNYDEIEPSLAITLHDVGGWHGYHWRKSFYENSIDRLAIFVNANKVTLVDTLWITDINEQSVEIAHSGKMGPSVGEIKAIARYAKSHGMSTELLVNFSSYSIDGWYETLDRHAKNKNTVFWNSFFQEFEELLMQRVKIADEVGIDSIILDHKATFRLAPISHLKPLIAKIRGNSGFSGELGHLALVSIKRQRSGFDDVRDWKGEAAVEELFSLFDFIGFEAQDIYNYEALKNYISKYKKYNMPIHLMVSTPSVSDGDQHERYIEPAGRFHTSSMSVDEVAQLSAYKKVIQLFEDDEFNFIKGINSWGYALNDDLTFGQSSGEAAYEKSASIRCQLAESELSELYKRENASWKRNVTLRSSDFENRDWFAKCIK